MSKTPRKQCKKCPWKKSTDPFDIPDGYDPDKHAALASTIAEPGRFDRSGPMHIFTGHETGGKGEPLPCVGWLANQLGEGNNLLLRLRVHRGEIDANVRTVGPQHACFQDTLPKSNS